MIDFSDGIPEMLPDHPGYDDTVDHAPIRRQILSPQQEQLAIRNALRYFDPKFHSILGPEFFDELKKYGRIYMYRFRPTQSVFARPIEEYKTKSKQAAAIMLMIQNNLDPAVAQFPHELITYGGNGAVFQNWAQYLLTMKYLSQMTDEQTLVMYSGHPLGLFPSHKNAPRVTVTNGMVIPNYSTQEHWETYNALGVSQYGQMTAGSYMYIGPQGIVHGTTITILNAARKHLGSGDDLGGVTFVTSGLGGMSGAQAKAAVIAGAACIVSEMNEHAARKRHEQGWLSCLSDNVDEAIDLMLEAKAEKIGRSIGYIGNIVQLLERLVERNVVIDLLSDQTSLHNPWHGGYFPIGLDFEEAKTLMAKDTLQFKEHVKESLRRHAKAINQLSQQGSYFFDYGNAFLLEASRSGADVMAEDGLSFRYPSYVEDIMGPMCFDFGFGPFRWVCASGKSEDLAKSDEIAINILTKMIAESPQEIQQQLKDNIRWITEAASHRMVVGSQARILYADAIGRQKIGLAFNKAIREGIISDAIILGRDHHDVSGTDSPYRETSNIRDGSRFTADMSVQNFVGDAFRGATWVSLHNGGGVGWGEVINGGFGMVIDGSNDADKKIQSMLDWDVNNGVARRAWARNEGAEFAIKRAMSQDSRLQVTIPNHVDEKIFERLGDSI